MGGKLASLETEVTNIREKQDSDGETLELTASQVGRLTMSVGEVKPEVGDVKKAAVKIENGHGEKLSALFDGYKQNGDKLDRIEDEVSKQEEVMPYLTT